MGFNIVRELHLWNRPDITPAETLLLHVLADSASDEMPGRPPSRWRRTWYRDGWNQDEIARRVHVSTAYVGNLFSSLARKHVEVREVRGVDSQGRPVIAHRGQQTTFRLPRFLPDGRVAHLDGRVVDASGAVTYDEGFDVLKAGPAAAAAAAKGQASAGPLPGKTGKARKKGPASAGPKKEKGPARAGTGPATAGPFPANGPATAGPFSSVPSCDPPHEESADRDSRPPSDASLENRGDGPNTSTSTTPDPYRQERAETLAAPHLGAVPTDGHAKVIAAVVDALNRGCTGDQIKEALKPGTTGLVNPAAGLASRVEKLIPPPPRDTSPDCLMHPENPERSCRGCHADVKGGCDPFVGREHLRPDWWFDVYGRPRPRPQRATAKPMNSIPESAARGFAEMAVANKRAEHDRLVEALRQERRRWADSAGYQCLMHDGEGQVRTKGECGSCLYGYESDVKQLETKISDAAAGLTTLGVAA